MAGLAHGLTASRVSGEELVEGVLVPDVLPHLGDLAVADWTTST
jgi:hypothetical protein